MRRLLPAVLAAVAGLLAACGGSSTPRGGAVTIAVQAPFSGSATVATAIAQGAELAARELNARGGVIVDGRRREVRIERLDSALSPARAVANVRRALRDGAIAIVDEGTGVDASWRIAARAGVPIGITYQGGAGLVDPRTRRNVFRIAPTDRGVAFRLAEYLVPKHLRLALIHDDSDDGQAGAVALAPAFARNPEAVAARITVPAGGGDLSAEMLRARRAGATGVLVWARAPAIAAAVEAARTAGWNVPFYAPPTAADPVLRQVLAGHPGWLDGLVFATGRMTAESGPASFLAFQRRYVAAFGADDVGVRSADGRAVTLPPETAMYSYDFVNVLAAALVRDGGRRGAPLVSALEQVDVRGANGDERGFNHVSHEGVVDDDVFFARFADMVYRPVTDDPLSSTLPYIEQRR